MSASRQLRLLFAAAEVAPFAKVGGLADVAGSLPQALAALGHDVRVALPLYATIDRAKWGITTAGRALAVRFDGADVALTVREIERGGVRVLLFDEPRLLGRPKVYGEADDDRRFALFCRAVAEYAAAGDWRPDVVHAHDWHTALVPQLLKQVHAKQLPTTASVFTIHNLAYQGTTKSPVLRWVGLPSERLLIEKKRYGKQVVPMARGIAFTDIVSTVSERYAEEILTPEFGERLEPLLEERRGDLYGIVNGIDTQVFDPATDPHIAAHYGLEDRSGKDACKAALQQEFSLAVDAARPVAGVVGRLVEQKGVDLLTAVAPSMLERGWQLVVLGTGDPAYEEKWRALAKLHADALGLRIGFDLGLAQRIYAGADAFLMPSRFEPCGLGQLIALRYGTVPIVRAVGGLVDTVHDVDAEPQRGNGFSFEPYEAPAFLEAIARAQRVWRGAPEHWRELSRRGMREDHSWAASAREYVGLYTTALENRVKAEGAA